MAVLSPSGDINIKCRQVVLLHLTHRHSNKVHFFFLVSSVVQASVIVTRIDVDNLLLEMNDSKEKIQKSKSTQYIGGDARQVITHYGTAYMSFLSIMWV